MIDVLGDPIIDTTFIRLLAANTKICALIVWKTNLTLNVAISVSKYMIELKETISLECTSRQKYFIQFWKKIGRHLAITISCGQKQILQTSKLMHKTSCLLRELEADVRTEIPNNVLDDEDGRKAEIMICWSRKSGKLGNKFILNTSNNIHKTLIIKLTIFRSNLALFGASGCQSGKYSHSQISLSHSRLTSSRDRKYSICKYRIYKLWHW